jgi:Hypothetical protein (DUF2513)
MRRDMDLLRSLLLKVEEQADGSFTTIEIPGHSESEVRYHAQLAQGAGFIEAEFMMDGFIVTGLTWAGHEFLDAAREDKLWNKAKQTVLKNAGTLTVEALKTALAFSRQKKLVV